MNDSDEVGLMIFIIEKEHRCDECGGEFLMGDTPENKPVMFINVCPLHGEEQMFFHTKCVPEDLRLQWQQNETRRKAKLN